MSYQSTRDKNWRIIAEKMQGSSHVHDNTPCEDFYCVETLASSYKTDYQSVLMIFVADGAGSAKFGGQGSKIACESAIAYTKASIEKRSYRNTLFDDEWTEKLITHIQTTIQKAVRTNTTATKKQCQQSSTNDDREHITEIERSNVAQLEPLTLRDYACTFLGVIVTDKTTLLIQVGDGAIVLSNVVLNDDHSTESLDLHCPIQPAFAEYANMTHFVTDEHAIKHLQTHTQSKVPKKIAVMSDGLQRLALNMADFTPHVPFFTPFFSTLQRTEVSDTDLQTALTEFLQSDAVNQRTDDDKTLVLALNVNA